MGLLQSIAFSSLQCCLQLKVFHCETMMVKAKIICSIISEQYLSITGAEWM